MNIVTNIRTAASHDKEYRRLEFNQWNPYTTKEYKIGDSLPADSVFLGNTNGNLLFKILRSKPRSLPVIDSEIINKVSLYFYQELSTLSKFSLALEQFVEQNIFTTDEESMWYYKYRKFEIEITENLVTVDIVGK